MSLKILGEKKKAKLSREGNLSTRGNDYQSARSEMSGDIWEITAE